MTARLASELVPDAAVSAAFDVLYKAGWCHYGGKLSRDESFASVKDTLAKALAAAKDAEIGADA